MLTSNSSDGVQGSLFSGDILSQLDPADPLLHLARVIPFDSTVQEKYITYPTDAKLAIKIINRLNKLAKRHDVAQRRTFVKEVKGLRLDIRFSDMLRNERRRLGH